jgi:superfamily I DNA/RNA helicase
MRQKTLTHAQNRIVEYPINASIFLEGPAGCGKTTTSVERLSSMLERGVGGESILILVPQRTLAMPYTDRLLCPNTPPGSVVTILTLGGLAKRTIENFWPLVAKQAGFAQPDRFPYFLTMETTQYFLAHLVRPLINEGYFESITIDRNRLYSQIIDNLNKSAIVGFPITEINERLTSAWIGEPGQIHVFDDAQKCATMFREYCLEHNLLDFSLQMEIFLNYLWPNPNCRDYLINTYRHLIVDNIEENPPVAYDLLKEWIPLSDSILLIYDWRAGYRRFLGADPERNYELKGICNHYFELKEPYNDNHAIISFGNAVADKIYPKMENQSSQHFNGQSLDGTIVIQYHRYFPEMLDWVTDEIKVLEGRGVLPGEIVVIAPFFSDALRFSLADRLTRLGIPSHSHRPSRQLIEEPVIKCLLTLISIAHPKWGFLPSKYDFAYALIQTIKSLDLIRAHLLANTLYQIHDSLPILNPFDVLAPDLQERITYQVGEKYEQIRNWLEEYRGKKHLPLDYFLSKLFGELLSQPSYGFHGDLHSGEIIANLIESIRKFRQAAGTHLATKGVPLGAEYLQMVQEGVIAAQYMRSWGNLPENAVLLAPAYTYLMTNRLIDYQFWLDIGSRGWYERIFQPLTHPYVLSRHWPIGQPWTDSHEYENSLDSLSRLITGLTRRCRQRIYLNISDLSEQGYEQRGILLKAINRLQTLNRND